MNIFFDFDDVLFDTRAFKKGFLDLFIGKFNLTVENFETSYKKARERDGISNYIFENHLKILNLEFGLSKALVEQEVKYFAKDLSKYVIEDVKKSLETLNDMGHTLYIVTFGSKFIQDIKISGSGLTYLFKDIIITEGDKGEAVSRLFKKNGYNKKKSIFVDDRINHLQKIITLHPNMNCVVMIRPEGRYTKKMIKDKNFSNYLSVENMNDLVKLIATDIY